MIGITLYSDALHETQFPDRDNLQRICIRNSSQNSATGVYFLCTERSRHTRLFRWALRRIRDSETTVAHLASHLSRRSPLMMPLPLLMMLPPPMLPLTPTTHKLCTIPSIPFKPYENAHWGS